MRPFATLVASLLALSGIGAGLGGCQTNPATGRSQLRLVSSDQVSQLGTEARPQLIEEYGGEVPQQELRDYVAEVGNRVASNVESEFDDIEWTFTVLDSDVINAFALPGGHVFISRGLLARFDNEAQVAGVLGHEIGHVTGRHIDERISQSMGFELGLAGLGVLTDSQIAHTVAQLFANGYQLRFGRNQETESDVLGVRYMVEAGYDPHGMLEVLDVLREASEGAAAPPEFLSTHPYPETRIEVVTDLLEDEYAHTQGDPSYGKFENRFAERARPHLGPRQSGAAGSDALAGVWCSTCNHQHR